MKNTMEMFDEFLAQKDMVDLSRQKETTKMNGLMKYEKLFNKPIYEFNREEIETMLFLIKSGSSIYLRATMNYLKQFTDFVSENYKEVENSYNLFPTREREYKKYLSKVKTSQQFIPSEELFEIIDGDTTLVEKSILILLYYGIGLEKQRFIESSQLKNDGVIVDDELISIPKKHMDYILMADKEDYDKYLEAPYIESKYLYKKTVPLKYEQLSYNKMFKMFKEAMENFGYPLTKPTDIAMIRIYEKIKEEFPTIDELENASTEEFTATVKKHFPDYNPPFHTRSKMIEIGVYDK